MSSIFYSEPELVIGLCKRIIFVNPNDLQIFKDITLPDDLSECGLKIANFSEKDEQQQNEIKPSQKFLKEEPTIQHVKVSPNRQLLAVTTAGQKALLLYKLRLEHAKLLSIRSLARTSSALAFSSDSNRLLVTDKTGDCYEYNCDQYETAPKLLFGHLSIVYEILWSSDEKYVISCDRDDKIRITNYPATYDIHSYCLGHKEFVAGLELLNEDILLSISGDKTIKIWDFKQGKELSSIPLPAPAIKFVLKRLEDKRYEIAVLLHQPDECVAIFELIHTEGRQWNFTAPQLLSFENIICCNLCYARDRLFVTGIKNDKFVIRLSPKSPKTALNWLEMVEEQFHNYSWTPENISAWFKKKYDNVSEYLDRKKRRIEDKSK